MNRRLQTTEHTTIQHLCKLVVDYNINIKTIIDAGAYDLSESIILSALFSAEVISFECNSFAIPICRERLTSGITLIEKCINIYDGYCKFYQNNKEKTITTHPNGNQAASSLFKANDQYTPEKYVQDEVNVECTRIDTVLKNRRIEKVNLLWMDLQGAELFALKSCGNYLKDIDIIVSELETNPIYDGQCLFSDVEEFLNENFFLVYGDKLTSWFDNFIFINKKHLI
jgi:FkbM family methyltransferase